MNDFIGNQPQISKFNRSGKNKLKSIKTTAKAFKVEDSSDGGVTNGYRTTKAKKKRRIGFAKDEGQNEML